MKKGQSFAALGAMVSSALTLVCCLPIGFAGAAGLAGLAVVFGSLRPWLLLVAVILLGTGVYQSYRGVKCGVKQSRVNLILLGLAAVVVVVVTVFPQNLALWLADFFAEGGK